MRAGAEHTNPNEVIWHALTTKTGRTAFCGRVVDEGEARVEASGVPREQRCGTPECQDAFQAMFETED